MGWYLRRSSISMAEPCAAALWKWRTSFCRSNRADLSGLGSQTATSLFFCALAADETSASTATSRPALPIDVMPSPRGSIKAQSACGAAEANLLQRQPQNFRKDVLKRRRNIIRDLNREVHSLCLAGIIYGVTGNIDVRQAPHQRRVVTSIALKAHAVNHRLEGGIGTNSHSRHIGGIPGGQPDLASIV